jgi:glycerate 2-kinase
MQPSLLARSQRWLVAPDSFKGTFTAFEAAEALAEGLRRQGQATDMCPLADGGEGTTDVLVDALGGSLERALVRDPLGRPIQARFALLDDGVTAVVETAEASGLGLVTGEDRDAELASSAGTGDLIVAAARAGAEHILVGVGSSACTDGGVGAIGAIRAGGGLDGARLVILCDTTTPFEAAASVFAPQKGASRECVSRLAARLDRIAARLPRDPRGVPMSGCAGGLSGGLWSCFDARLCSGAEVVLDAVQFDGRAQMASHVVTGEGCLDNQSIAGKLLGVVARRARAAGAQVHTVVGHLRLTDSEIDELGLDGLSIEASSRSQLIQAGERLGRFLSSRPAALADEQGAMAR